LFIVTENIENKERSAYVIVLDTLTKFWR